LFDKNAIITKEKAQSLDLYINSHEPHILSSSKELGKTIGLKRIEQFKTLNLLLFNLQLCRNNALITPRARASFGVKRYNYHKVGYKALCTVLDALAHKRYIEQVIGKKNLETGESVSTTALPTHKLISFFKDNDWSWNYCQQETPELVLLRNDKKKLIDYKDNKYSNWLRSELTKYNDFLAEDVLIELCKKNKKTGALELIDSYYNLTLQRKFIEHDSNEYGGVILNFGGRMYGPWCNLSSSQRKLITIDGEETVELDLQASAVNVLYKTVTGERYSEGDPYNIEIDSYTIPRHIVKKAATIMLSTSTIQSAVAALEKHYLPYINDFDKDTRSKNTIKEAQEYKAFKFKLKPSELLNLYLNKHKVVRYYYLRGKRMGDLVACMESDRVFEIVRRLTKLKIPVLTVYDSFIVKQSDSATLETLMEELPRLRGW
jgi:small nuclear ribonucleoprotein (snRNP)-like protein